MTAKQKLLKEAPGWSEREAEVALGAVEAESSPESFERWLQQLPEDDEPLTAEEKAAIDESDEDIAAGRVSSLDEVKNELGIE